MPAPDHPWYGSRGKQRRPSRTISDELAVVQLNQLTKTEHISGHISGHFIDDETVRGARDPATAPLYGGGAMRKPVRYD